MFGIILLTTIYTFDHLYRIRVIIEYMHMGKLQMSTWLSCKSNDIKLLQIKRIKN